VLVSKEMAPPRMNFDGGTYHNAPGCETVAVPLSELVRALPNLAKSHHRALEITTDRGPLHRNRKAAHSPGVTKWLSQVLHDEVPSPAWTKPGAHRSGRRPDGEIVVDDDFLKVASMDELRKVALLVAPESFQPKKREAIYRVRAKAVRLYVLKRANGRCEGCSAAAPFYDADGRPFLETHHTTRMADDGPDHPQTVIGICPNCHRRAHLARDAESFNASLIRKLPKLEAAARKR